MFITQAFEDPLRGVALLVRRLLVGLQDRINDADKWIKLGPNWCLGTPIAWRRRIAAHLGDRVPADAEHPSGFAPTVTLN